MRCERLASETTTERDTRVRQTRGRMATEITDERDARLEYERASHREQQTVQSQLPLFQHVFHPGEYSYIGSVCVTCSERYPGLQLHSNSTEHLHCSRDKHTPKVYSSDNNMNPGPIPSQLQVSNIDT